MHKKNCDLMGQNPNFIEGGKIGILGGGKIKFLGGGKMVLEGGKFKIFSALRADEKRRSAPGILPPPRKNPGYAPDSDIPPLLI